MQGVPALSALDGKTEGMPFSRNVLGQSAVWRVHQSVEPQLPVCGHSALSPRGECLMTGMFGALRVSVGWGAASALGRRLLRC